MSRAGGRQSIHHIETSIIESERQAIPAPVAFQAGSSLRALAVRGVRKDTDLHH
jgi:hypothetical protein